MNLAAEMAKLPEPITDQKPPHWAYWRWDLWKRAQEDVPENFTRWPCVYHCMLVDHWWPEPMQTELGYVLGELGTDNFSIAGQSEYRNAIHQAYHLLRWEAVTGKRIADMQSIYEFGGGYGAMALIANRLGFRGKYYIYDLPEFALLQQWYLGQMGITGVEWRNRITALDADLLIACYSLSETTIEQRDRVLDKVRANSYLLLYSAEWEEYDNRAYFGGLDFGKTWAHSHIAHLPPESWYTWGW